MSGLAQMAEKRNNRHRLLVNKQQNNEHENVAANANAHAPRSKKMAHHQAAAL